MTLGGQFVKLAGEAIPTALEDLARKTDTDAALAGKAPLASPALSGVPTAPTAVQPDSSSQIATTQYVQEAIVGGAAGALPLAGGIMTGVIRSTIGSAAAPGVAVGEANTGVFRSAASQLALTTGGAERARIDSSGFRTPAAAAFATRFGTVARTPWLQVLSTTIGLATEAIGYFAVNVGGATKFFIKSRGATVGAHASVPNNDSLGSISWGGSDGTKIIEAARMTVEVEGTTAADTMGGRIVFLTTPLTAAAVPVERLRINRDGDLQAGGANTFLSSARHFQLRSYTDATKPSASPNGQMIYISDIDGGTLAVSDGSVWDVVGGAPVAGDFVAKAGDTMTGALILNADPAVALGAATKQYVDTFASLASPAFTGTPTAPTAAADTNTTQIASTAYVQTELLGYARLAGSPIFAGGVTFNEAAEFNDEVIINTPPTFPVHAATKGYVDDADALLMPKNGGTFTGDVTFDTSAAVTFSSNAEFNDEVIINTTPSFGVHAVNKDYVDDNFAPKASPILSGTPTAPTAANGTSNAQIATTAFVQSAIGSGAGIFLPLSGGAMTGLLTLSGAPSASLHAATKAYADLKAPIASPAFTGTPTAPTPAGGDNSTKVATTAFVNGAVGGFGGPYVPAAGGGFTGYVTVHAYPLVSNQIANKGYVDQEVNTCLALSGGIMSGALTLSAVAPTADHAVKKSYVDTADNLRMLKTGGTFTGVVTHESNVFLDRTGDATTAILTIDADSGHSSLLRFATAGVTRWQWGKGSDNSLVLQAFAAGGGLVGTALGGNVDTLALNFGASPTAPTPAPADNSSKLATTAFVHTIFGAPTVVDAMATSVGNAPDFFEVSGYAAVGDGGPGLWNQEADIATVPAQLKFNIGANYYINRTRKIRPEEAGAKGTGLFSDAAANVAAFNALLNSSEHGYIEIPKAAVYKFNAPLVRTQTLKGVNIDLHPDAELDFSQVTSGAGAIMISIAGTQGTPQDTIEDITPGELALGIVTSAGFAAGRMFRIMSDALFDPFEPHTGSPGDQSGNLAEIGMIVGTGAQLMTALEPIDDIYLMADNAKIYPISQVGRLRISGGRIRGNPAIAHRGLMLQFVQNPLIEGTHFVDFVQGALVIQDCLGGKVDGIDVYGAAVPTLGYGVSIQDSTRGFSVTKSNFRRTRHAVTLTNDYSPNGGVQRDITVDGNFVYGTAEAGNDAMDTHNNALRVRFLNNDISDSLGNGIHAECPEVEASGNIIRRTANSGIVQVNGAGRNSKQEFCSNEIDTCGLYGILVGVANQSGGLPISIRTIIRDNDIYRTGQNPIRIKDGGERATLESNYIDTYGGAATAGIQIESIDWIELDHNVSKNPELNIPAVWLTNCSVARISNEHHHVGTPHANKRGLKISGSCSDVSVENSKYTTSGGSNAGIAIEAEAGATLITIGRDVRMNGNWLLKGSVPNDITCIDKTLLEPITFTLLDDAFTFIPLPVHGFGTYVFSPRSTSGTMSHGMFYARTAGGTLANVPITAMAAMDFVTGVTIGSGATGGVDGKFTISVNNDGKIYFKNRIGGTVTVDVTMVS